MLSILLVDDEASLRMTLGDALRAAGHKVAVAADGAEGMDLISNQVFDVVISDIRLPKVDGLTLFRKVRSTSPSTDVILITGFGTVADAVTALKEGAHDYLTKPFDTDELKIRIERIAERRALHSELTLAREALADRVPDSGIVGQSPGMVALVDRIETIAASDAPVLITGESGTGKELVARNLHRLSARHAKPFVAVNCAAFPETLIEAELFGHERGAFTGAVRRREGRFKAADGGTLFLDEVAEVPLPAQAKLLRVLQEGAVEPLGTNTAVPVDVRLVSATHRNLKDWIAQGRFREDLYYRLNVLDVPIPPLRERRGDLPLLVEHFLRRFTSNGAEPPTISPKAWAALGAYTYPGNVRELEHAIQHAVVLARGKEIDVQHLPTEIAGGAKTAMTHPDAPVRPLSAALKSFEKEYLLRVLGVAGGKKAKAAEMLGISRKNLWEKLRAHDIHTGADGEHEEHEHEHEAGHEAGHEV